MPRLLSMVGNRLGILYLCDLHKRIAIEQRSVDVLSIPNYVIKKGPSHGARHGPTERPRIYFIAHNVARKAKWKNDKSILDRFRRCQLYRDSQTNLGWNEHIFVPMM